MSSNVFDPSDTLEVFSTSPPLVLDTGLSEMSAVGFVWYGSMIAKRGSIQEGHKFILLAQAILDKFEEIDHHKPLSSMEVLVTATQLRCFFEPTQALAIDDMWAKGESLAQSLGDLHFGCLFRIQ